MKIHAAKVHGACTAVESKAFLCALYIKTIARKRQTQHETGIWQKDRKADPWLIPDP
jgi:hypothetical protein